MGMVWVSTWKSHDLDIRDRSAEAMDRHVAPGFPSCVAHSRGSEPWQVIRSQTYPQEHLMKPENELRSLHVFRLALPVTVWTLLKLQQNLQRWARSEYDWADLDRW